nr:immunoglobulin light chain junction region [Macaca mulatta]
CQQSHRSPSTF